MKKSIRNLILGAAMAIGVFAASLSAFAGQFVQNDMNFRSGASTTSTIIGSVPAGAQVEVLGQSNGFDLVKYNGVTGYIHSGNLGDSYTAPKQAAALAKAQTSANGTWKTVYVNSGYLALREAPTFEPGTEIGQLYTGDTVRVDGECAGSYIYVYSPKYGTSGWVNAGFLG